MTIGSMPSVGIAVVADDERAGARRRGVGHLDGEITGAAHDERDLAAHRRRVGQGRAAVIAARRYVGVRRVHQRRRDRRRPTRP